MVNKAVKTNEMLNNVKSSIITTDEPTSLEQWQIEQMHIGLEQAKKGIYASKEEVHAVFNKCKITA